MGKKIMTGTTFAIDDRIEKAWRYKYNWSLQKCLVLACLVGSHAHGTYIPNSDPSGIDDRDFVWVVVPPPQDVITTHKPFETWTFRQDELDLTVHSLAKFVHLIIDQNPNMLQNLWLPEDCYLYEHPSVFPLMQRGPDLAKSRLVYHSFIGYANGQLQRMFKAPDEKMAYMGQKRKSLLEQHGYDTKAAAHAIRLLRTGLEYIKNGNMRVCRTYDADLIKSIKQGNWSLEKVKSETDVLFDMAKTALEVSPLPEQPCKEILDQIYRDITLQHWSSQGYLRFSLEAV
jgi:predicted nucleotidyltransferase